MATAVRRLHFFIVLGLYPDSGWSNLDWYLRIFAWVGEWHVVNGAEGQAGIRSCGRFATGKCNLTAKGDCYGRYKDRDCRQDC